MKKSLKKKFAITGEVLRGIGGGVVLIIVLLVICLILIVLGPVLTLFGTNLIGQSIAMCIIDPPPKALVLDYGSYDYEPMGKLELPYSDTHTLFDLREGYKLYLGQSSDEVNLLFTNPESECSEVKTIPKDYVFEKDWKLWPLAGLNISIEEVHVLPQRSSEVAIEFTPVKKEGIMAFFTIPLGLVCLCVGLFFTAIIIGVIKDYWQL